MRVLVFGAGMYVTGRGTTGEGTILPALAEASKKHPIESVTLVATTAANAPLVAEATAQINQRLATTLPVEYRRQDQALELSDYDCAIISVPDHLHHTLGLRVLEAGLHCLMVKPLTPTVQEAEALIAAQERAGVYAVVEFHKRFDEANLLVKRLLAEQALGRLSYATVEYSQRLEVPLSTFAGWSSQTNIFQYLGVHYVDLLAFLTGFLPRRVLALGTRGILSTRGIDSYDSVHAIVQWQRETEAADDPFVSQLATSWIDAAGSAAASEQRYTLVGERGRICCDQTRRGLQLTRDDGIAEINPYFSQYLATPGGQRFAGYGPASVMQFIEDVVALQSGQVDVAELDATRPTFRATRPATSVVDAANRSLAASGSWVEI